MRKLLLALALFPSFAWAQTPSGTIGTTGNAGAYNSVAKTCTDGAFCYIQTDVNGNLKTTASGISGTVAIDQTTPGTTNAVQAIPGTSGGLSVYFLQPLASDNHAVIKAGAGQVYKISATNNSATINYLRLYNATTGFNGCGSATGLVYQVLIPGNSTNGGGIIDSWSNGMAFSTGISICVTSAYATTDTTNATASAMSVNIGYK